MKHIYVDKISWINDVDIDNKNAVRNQLIAPSSTLHTNKRLTIEDLKGKRELIVFFF